MEEEKRKRNRALHTRSRIRFGPYELDLRTAELRKNTLRIRLQEQPFLILVALLERPGELVLREEIRNKLWPDDTVVEFDHGINAAVKRLREALCDSVEKPRYIETLSRRGYRFIGKVEFDSSEQTESSADRREIFYSVDDEVRLNPESPRYVETLPRHDDRFIASVNGEVFPSEARAETSTASGGRARRRLWLTLGAAGVAVGVAVGFAFTYFLTRSEPVPKASHYVQLTRDGKRKNLVGSDGSRIYLYISGSDYQGLAELSTDGGEPKQLPIIPARNMQVLSLSGDGTKFLVLDGLGFPPRGPFYSLPVLGGSPRRLGNIVGQDARWSPDGKMLAYSSGGDLFTAKDDGSEPRKLISLTDQFGLFGLVWSPDGSHLRFDNRWGNSTPSTWEVSADGTGLHRMFPGGHNPDGGCCGTWTTGGKYFLLLSQNQIWALPRKGGFLRQARKPIQLTSSPMFLSSPLPSKDGKKLFVVGETIHGELMRLDVKSGQFAPFLGGVSAECPAFSKDGQWVAYTSYPEGILYRSKADGSDRLQLTFPPNHAYKPRWSPDGKSLVFSAWVNKSPSKVVQISRDGGTPTTLVPEGPSGPGEPSWSPDGNKILFGGKPHDPTSQIRILDLITRQVSIVPGSEGLFSPVWSPNGRYIAAFTGDSRALMLFDFETKKWSELAQGSIGWPNFSKDGKYIYVIDFQGTANFSGTSALLLLKTRISDHSTERIAIPKNFAGTGQVGLALALGFDDSPLLLHDAGSYDVYSLDWENP